MPVHAIGTEAFVGAAMARATTTTRRRRRWRNETRLRVVARSSRVGRRRRRRASSCAALGTVRERSQAAAAARRRSLLIYNLESVNCTRGAMFIAWSSWNKSLHAYGSLRVATSASVLQSVHAFLPVM